MKNEMRLISVAMNPHDVVQLLNLQINPPQFLSRIVGENIPDDAEVVNISHDIWDHQIAVILRHSSFPECQQGQGIPRHPKAAEHEYIQVPDEIREFLNPQHGWKDAPDSDGYWHMCRLYLPESAPNTPVQHHHIINVFSQEEICEHGSQTFLTFMEYGDTEAYSVDQLVMREIPPGYSPYKFKLISRPPFPDIPHDSIVPLSEPE